MTEGSIYKKIVAFALPIFWGNLFQQMYNVVDSLVLGNFAGRNSLAAVSATGSLIFLLVGFLNGIFMGAGVVISRYFGARDNEKVQAAIHTTIAFALIAGAVLTVFGVLCTPLILRLMQTPEDVFPKAVTYVRIYFAGILTIVLYNAASGIHQAVGDSKHPLYYLIAASLVNVVLDIVFVAVFNWDIGGTAIATVISQGVSAVLSFRHLFKSKEVYQVRINKIRIDRQILGSIIKIGLPSGLQNSVISLANVVVQSNINAFGAAAVAGCGAYSKVEGFVFIPITSFALSMSTFVSQNLGAKQYDRVKEGGRFGVIAALLLAETFGIAYRQLAPFFIGLFSRESEVIAYGTSQAHTITLFYFLLAFSHVVAGILRGAGKSIIPMFIMLGCWCVFRVTYVTIATSYIHDIRVVFWAYPITWSLSSIFYLIFYLKRDWVYGFEKKTAPEAGIRA